MNEDIEIRVFRLVDGDGTTLVDNVPQQITDELPDFITYRNRLFFVAARDDQADDSLQRYLCVERFCLRAGSATITAGDDPLNVDF